MILNWNEEVRDLFYRFTTCVYLLGVLPGVSPDCIKRSEDVMAHILRLMMTQILHTAENGTGTGRPRQKSAHPA